MACMAMVFPLCTVIGARHAPAGSKTSAGFTLMELLIVALIMTMSMGVFLGYNFRQRDAVQLRSAAREVHQWMRASRSHALLEGAENMGKYHVQEHVLRSNLRDHTLSLPEAVEVKLVDGEARDSVPVLLFYADGSAERSSVVLRIEDREITILVDPVLGETHIVR